MASPLPVARKLTFTQAPNSANINGESIKVFLRVRPFTSEEEKTGEANCISQASGSTLAIKAQKAPMDESKYTFTSVFPPKTSQEELFTGTALPLVESFLQGHNGLLFAYGITNAGKTYTITGKPQDPVEKGVLPRVLDVIFNSIQPDNKDSNTESVAMDPTNTYWIWLSYFEIYNDQIIDLLATNDPNTKKVSQKALHDETGKHSKVNEVIVHTRQEAEEIIRLGMKARTVGSTLMNGDSSRSHAMLTIRLFQYTKDLDPKTIANRPDLIRTTKLSIVDLAGSERQGRTQTTGARLKEAGSINNSLLTLGRCLEALRWNQSHASQPQRVVPFRDTKLTRALQDYFVKESKVVMMVNINPCGKDYEETNNALKFAAVAKEITTTTRLDTRRPTVVPTPATAKKRKVLDTAEKAPKESIVPKEMEGTPFRAGESEELKKEVAKREEAEREIAYLKMQLDDQEIHIREEVAQEMAEAMCKMENQYRIKLAQELDDMEEVCNKKIAILTRVAEAFEQGDPTIYSSDDSKQIEKYQKMLLQKEELIVALEAKVETYENKVTFLNEKISTMTADSEQDTALIKARLEQEVQELKIKLEANSKSEVSDTLNLLLRSIL